MHLLRKNKKKIFIISILLGFLLLIYSFQYKLGFSDYKYTKVEDPTFKNEEIKSNYPEYKYALVGNKSKTQCAIYLYDKSTRIELDNFSKENIYCDKVLRVSDNIVYRSASTYNEEEDKEIVSKDWYYFNFETKKKLPLFLSSAHSNAALNTVILSEDSKYLFLATSHKAWLYEIKIDKPQLLKEIDFGKEVFLREKLISQELITSGFAAPSYDNLYTIGTINLDNHTITYKDNLKVGKNQSCDYEMSIDTSKNTYEEVVENCK